MKTKNFPVPPEISSRPRGALLKCAMMIVFFLDIACRTYAIGPPAYPRPLDSIMVFVTAATDSPGIDTGVDLAAGEMLTVTASGLATYGGDCCDCGSMPETDPDGMRYNNGVPCAPKNDPNATLPTAPIGALIGKIGAGAWFFVGSSYSNAVSDAGRLFLMYNDVPGSYGNNRGGYDASIGPITLRAAGRKVGGINTARLRWRGAISTNIDVYRNGIVIATVSNTGTYTDSTGDTGRARYTYRVCEAGAQNCSNDVLLQ